MSVRRSYRWSMVALALAVSALLNSSGLSAGARAQRAAWAPPLAASHNSIGLKGPYGVAVDTQGNAYVTDGDATAVRVLKVSPAGHLLATWRVGRPPADPNAVALTGIAVDAHGSVYVADAEDNHLLKLSPSGRVIARWPLAVSIGSVKASMWSASMFPIGVAVDQHGHVYVAASTDSQILTFSSTGTPLARWGAFDRSSGTLSAGTDPGQFDSPTGVAVDGQGNVYVVDHRNNRLQKLSPSGRVLAVWPRSPGADSSAPGQFNQPEGIALDRRGNVYVIDYSNSRLQKLSPTGQPLAQWAMSPMPSPGIAVDRQGVIYLADAGQPPRVVKVSPSGHKLAEWH